MTHNRIDNGIADRNGYVDAELPRDRRKRRTRDEAYRFSDTERFEIGREHHVHFVIVRRADRQIKRRDPFFLQKRFVSRIGAKNICRREALGCNLRQLFVAVDYDEFLRPFDKLFRKQIEERALFFRLNQSFRDDRTDSSRSDKRNVFQFFLFGTAEREQFGNVFFCDDDADTVTGVEKRIAARKRGFAVFFDVCDKEGLIGECANGLQFLPRKLALLCDRHARQLIRIVSENLHVAHRAAFDRLDDSFAGFHVGMDHVIDAVQRSVLSAERIRMALFCSRRIDVVRIVAHPRDLYDVGINRIDKRTGYHIHFVVFRNAYERVGFRDARFFERFQIVAVGEHHRTVELIRNVTHVVFIVVDDRNGIFFIN